MATFYCTQALLETGWANDVLISAGADGRIEQILTGETPPADAVRLHGAVFPGMPNLHSHAFQRAMAGLAEVSGPSDDSFWTWRKVMYGFLGQLTPEHVEAIAAQLYIDMLKAGFTAVGEFHYVHHGPNGEPYENLTELSDRVIEAARQTGIAITHLPVLYAFGGFGGQAPVEGQRRFLNDADQFLTIVDTLRSRHADDPQVRVGIAPHSLRAVTKDLLDEVLVGFRGMDPQGRVHIHIAEQTKEVDDCMAWCGRRPVDYLFDHFAVDDAWCLIHATHMDDAETDRLAASGAVAGLCPTTEANLGDGFFQAVRYRERNGAWGVGSDSHIAVSVADELRTYEYGQRLLYRKRNVLGGGEGKSTGASLYRSALEGGSRALGRGGGALAIGSPCDLVAVDTDLPAFAARTGDQLADAWIFASQASPVRDVVCGGRQVIADGRHADEDRIADRFRRTMEKLLQS